MLQILVDTNVLLDVLQRDPVWFDWSASQMALVEQSARLCTNAIIYAELCQRYATRIQVDKVVKKMRLHWLDLDRDSLYLASQAYGIYRQRGGQKANVLADFFIGAQAMQLQCSLLTRDTSRFVPHLFR